MTKKARVSEITGSLAELIHEVTEMGGYKDVRMMLSSVFSDLQRNGYHAMYPQQTFTSQAQPVASPLLESDGQALSDPQLDFVEYGSTDSMFDDDDDDDDDE